MFILERLVFRLHAPIDVESGEDEIYSILFHFIRENEWKNKSVDKWKNGKDYYEQADSGRPPVV